MIVPAGGAGRRLGGVLKPLLELRGEPVLVHCLRPFLARADVCCIVVAVPAELYDAPPAWLTADARVFLVRGGAERDESVRSALAAVPDHADVVLVHDAARPLVDGTVIERCIREAAAGRSVIAAVPVQDTIKRLDEHGMIVETPDRSLLRAAQTPQAFPTAILRSAHERAASDGVRSTDDAAVVAHYGTTVMVVDGALENIKITTPVDVVVAEALLARATAG